MHNRATKPDPSQGGLVHPRQDPDPRLLALAEAQAGVLSREQLTGLGLSRHTLARLLADGSWQRLGTEVYYLGRGRPRWLGQAWAGTLMGGPAARLGFGSAAHLMGLEPSEPSTVEVLVPHGRQVCNRHPWTFIRERSGARDARSPGAPSRTTVEDTVLDLTDRGSRRDAVGWATEAVQKRLTTVPRLRSALDRRPRLRHRRLLTALLADVAQGAESPLEVAYLRDVERAHGLPRANRQQTPKHAPHLRDVYYDDYATVVELDGLLGHGGRGRFRDMNRDNLATLAGEATLRFGWHDVAEEFCRIAFQVGSVLIHRGWNELPTRCQHCHHLPLELLVA